MGVATVALDGVEECCRLTSTREPSQHSCVRVAEALHHRWRSPPLQPDMPKREGLVTPADLFTRYDGSVRYAQVREGHRISDYGRERDVEPKPIEDTPPPPD